MGRAEERDRLRRLLDKAREKTLQVVAVLGEAGVGKTRLVTEIADEAARDALRVLVGRSYRSEQVMTFAPWLDAIRTAGVLSDRDVLDAVGPACRAELARVFPELGPPPRLAGRDGHGRFFEAMARLVG